MIKAAPQRHRVAQRERSNQAESSSTQPYCYLVERLVVGNGAATSAIL